VPDRVADSLASNHVDQNDIVRVREDDDVGKGAVDRDEVVMKVVRGQGH